MPLTLAAAQTIVAEGLAAARKAGMKPLCLAVLDARGAVTAVANEDGSSLKRYEIAHAKAFGALAFGMGSRKLQASAIERPHFMAAATHAVGGALIPGAGGVLIRDSGGAVVGAVGVSGDTSDNDEAAAFAGIVAAGFTPDGG
jgi:uncharacterized protein GlcG (DUF336 family)